MSNLNIGDQVITTNAGIWQIYRIDNFKSIDPLTKKVTDKSLIFVKRFINDSGKRSFTETFFSPAFIFKLDKDEVQKLEEFIKENTDIYDKFNKYKPKPIDSLFSCGIEVPKDKTSKEIAELIPKDKKLTELQIRELVDNLGYDTKSYPQWTIQFTSKGTELKDGYVRYEFNKVMEL